ncbi:MAG: hypothetical protein ACMUIM_09630 [bacterium]
MKWIPKRLYFFAILLSILPILVPNTLVKAQVFQFPSFQSQPLQVPSWQNPATGEGDILIDNFEYWDSPYNHGWRQIEPAYPVYGFGMGYATIFNTVLDLQEGSRVLDVYRPASIFLIGTTLEKHGIFYNLFTPPIPGSDELVGYIDLTKNPVLSFKFRAPIGIEPWDIFELDVIGITGSTEGFDITVKIKPVQPSAGTSSNDTYYSNVTSFVNTSKNKALEVTVYIGRNFLDGSWHAIWLDLADLVKNAVDDFTDISVKSDWYIAQADTLLVTGQMFRLDDIIFRAQDFSKKAPAHLFEIGPLYAQIFEPYRYLFLGDYTANGKFPHFTDFLLDLNNFITDPNQIRDAWINDLLLLDPNYHVIDPNHPQYDPNYTNQWISGDPGYGTPDPVAETYIRDGFFIDITLPVFNDPNLRISGNQNSELRNHGNMQWNMTVNGYGSNAIQAFLVQPLPINPYDGMPTYILTEHMAIPTIEVYGHFHYGPIQLFILESALWNSGVILWPQVAYMDYTPQYFEDLILTLQVTDGLVSDTNTFPLSVVNYPVENYAPVTQVNICARFFTVGEENECLIFFLDPDCFIFSLAQLQGMTPATSHLPMLPGNQIRTDQDELVFRMTINGLNRYQYGPWIDTIIDPQSGLTSFTPRFEGVLHTVVTCTDPFGASAFGERPIYCVNPGTWLNHPPIITASPQRPEVVRAGQELIITEMNIQDPDGDELYASCNIGSMGRTADGRFFWTFQSNFPGFYHVEVIFYDIRGGYAIMRIEVAVKPWWSY